MARLQSLQKSAKRPTRQRTPSQIIADIKRLFAELAQADQHFRSSKHPWSRPSKPKPRKHPHLIRHEIGKLIAAYVAADRAGKKIYGSQSYEALAGELGVPVSPSGLRILEKYGKLPMTEVHEHIKVAFSWRYAMKAMYSHRKKQKKRGK